MSRRPESASVLKEGAQAESKQEAREARRGRGREDAARRGGVWRRGKTDVLEARAGESPAGGMTQRTGAERAIRSRGKEKRPRCTEPKRREARRRREGEQAESSNAAALAA